MRAVAAVAFAAGALAVPFAKRQVVVTDVEVDYVTAVVTVTAGQSAPAASTYEKETTKAAVQSAPSHYGHHHWHPVSGGGSAWESTWVVTETPSQAPAPSSTYVAPTTSTTPAASPTHYSSSSSPAAQPTHKSSTTSSKSSTPTSYEEITVYHHNLHRANHSAPDLKWDAGLAATAQKIASSCVYAHNTAMDNGGYGQNIAAGVKPDNISAIITDMFYNGEVNWYEGLYGQAQPDMTNFEHWGHFSQVVWKETTSVGCATYDCSANGLANTSGAVSPFFTVCNYKGPGNFQGEYGDNVGSSLGHATCAWDDGL